MTVGRPIDRPSPFFVISDCRLFLSQIVEAIRVAHRRLFVRANRAGVGLLDHIVLVLQHWIARLQVTGTLKVPIS